MIHHCDPTIAAVLRRLEQRKRIFDLRRALERLPSSGRDTQFYRAVTAGRFGHESLAIDQLLELLATHPKPELERKAHEEMASALARIGRFGEAARAWSKALRVTAANDQKRSENENTRSLYNALRTVDPLVIEAWPSVSVQVTRNRLDSWDAPVTVNGHPSEWIIDTGANLCAVTQSEAAKMGLSTRKTKSYVRGLTEENRRISVAVASDLWFGAAHLRNVVVLVFPDEALYIDSLRYQVRGILGIPILRALGTVQMSASGLVRTCTNRSLAPAEPNIFFDELTPIVEIRYGDQPLQMRLDTGANKTFLHPSFRKAVGEIAQFKKQQQKISGAGGHVKRWTFTVPSLRLKVLDRSVGLADVSLLRREPSGKARHLDGVLGMDALASGFTLDFRAMQLRIE